MPYTFELSFSGLCILTFSPSLDNATEVDVVLVNARGHGHGIDDHLAYLSYPGRNMAQPPQPDHTLVPGPDGTQLALQELTDEAIEISVVGAAMPPLTPVWRSRAQYPNLPEAPDLAHPEQEAWLDWVMALQRMNPETDSPVASPPFNGLKQFVDPHLLVGARVKLTGGTLRADSFPRTNAVDAGTGLLNYVRWDFRVPPSGPGPLGPYAMAGRVVLSIPNLPDASLVVLQGRTLKTSLRPSILPNNTLETKVSVSITNLPASEGDVAPTTLWHVAHYYDLATFASGKPPLRLPVLHTGVITSTTVFCPPASHVPAK